MQEEFDKVITDKEGEISCVRDINHKLIVQSKKVKDKTQYNKKLEEENQHLKKNY